MYEAIFQLMRREAQRVVQAMIKPPRNAVITQVDPDTYSAKVRFEPHDASDPNNAESGWLPIQAIATGLGFGIFSVPKVGHPVEVDFQGGDHMTGSIKNRHVSQKHQPPEGMKEGEHHIVQENGAVMRFLADGTVFIGGAGTVKQRQGKDAATGQDGQQTQAEQPQGKQAFTLTPDGAFTFAHKSGGQIAMDKDGNVTVTTKDKAVTIDAGKGAISYSGQSHSFKGPISADGAISAQGEISTGAGISAIGQIAGGSVTSGGQGVLTS